MVPSRSSITLLLLTITTLLLCLSSAQVTFSQPDDREAAPTATRSVPSGINPYTTGTPTASVFPGAGNYVYVGCYNETTPLDGSPSTRALSGSGSKMEGDDALTPERCFDFCGGEQYAGLEYARECWCAPYLNSAAQKIDESWCDMPCMGGDESWCGGRLTLTLYNRTKGDEDGAAGSWRRSSGVWSVRLAGSLTLLMALL
ncbi:WSC-domain-containing protein [Pseudovirgaria hyperparasitica]|uniref:WSC-domain-containing protein n=1 Tax=Pseudovirgaria hyperparasitica TaxID=470096 RepID=A0A6A6VVP3_9PEZI|nr:WSC-domain-containing protein [Pseudovirgaria hyperparasitica]KAF2753700.1 WSC-domain-containing protein [Pseudovirgaria hyperparasitica]